MPMRQPLSLFQSSTLIRQPIPEEALGAIARKAIDLKTGLEGILPLLSSSRQMQPAHRQLRRLHCRREGLTHRPHRLPDPFHDRVRGNAEPMPAAQMD